MTSALSKRIILCGAIAFVLCGLFPPWLFSFNYEHVGTFYKTAGYKFIFTPPEMPTQWRIVGLKLDILRLAIEWACVLAITGAVWLVFVRLAIGKKRSPRIVIVDDEEGLLDLSEVAVRAWLKNATILKFTDGEEAWNELLRNSPDLLITDWNRPKLNGPELLSRLADKKVKYAIIVASAYAQEKDVSEFSKRGLNVRLLHKPYSVLQFLAELSHAVDPSNNPVQFA